MRGYSACMAIHCKTRVATMPNLPRRQTRPGYWYNENREVSFTLPNLTSWQLSCYIDKECRNIRWIFVHWIYSYILFPVSRNSARTLYNLFIYLFNPTVIYYLIINPVQYTIHILKCGTTAWQVFSKIVTDIQVRAGSHCIYFYIQYSVISDRVLLAPDCIECYC